MAKGSGPQVGAAILLAGLALMLITARWPAVTLADGPELWPSVVAYGWVTKTVDLPGPVTGGVSLALGPDGSAHLAFIIDNGAGSNTAYHAALIGSQWISQAIGTPAAATPSLLVGADGVPMVSYSELSNTIWITQSIEVTATGRPVLKVTGAGQVSIAYEYEAATIRYAWKQAGAWHTETAESSFAAPISLALDSFGRPHLAYCDPRELAPAGPGGGLRHAWRSPAGWVSEQALAVACTNTSLALDAGDSPHIAYYDSATGALGYARWAPQDTAGVIPTTGGLVVAVSGETAMTFGAGVFSETATVTHTVVHSSTVPAMELLQAPGQMGNGFTLEATYGDGSPAAPGEPFTLTVTYDDGGRGTVTEASLSLYWYDGNGWVAEPSIVNPVFNTVTATPTHFSLWAMFGEPLRTFLPIVLRAH